VIFANWLELESSQPQRLESVLATLKQSILKTFTSSLVILPKEYAVDFAEFCKLNRAPCPVLEMLAPGETNPKKICSTFADVRSDVPKYRIYKKGILIEEVSNIKDYWRDDLVSFFIGCSFSFEQALIKGDIPIRNIDEGRNVSMYKTNIQCTPYGSFSCPMVVSMRPVKKEKVKDAIEITGQFKETHGAPVHCGDPSVIGISDINKVDFGDSVTIKEGDV
jgi:uncharacterized protein YcsI (UPF0317 family)